MISAFAENDGLHSVSANNTTGAPYSSATLPNAAANPLFWAVWAQVVLNNSLMMFGFGFGVWAFFSRCSFGRSRVAAVASSLQPLTAALAAVLLLVVASRPPDNAVVLPVFLSVPVVVTLVMTLGLTPYLRSLKLELGGLVKHRVALTLASLASAMFIASLLSGLIMQLYFNSSTSGRVLIRLLLFPLLVEFLMLGVRAVARASFGPSVAAQNTLFFLLPPMLTASLVGRFLSTNLETVQETVAVSLAVASMEMLLRFTLPYRDAAFQSMRRTLCCAAPLHEPGTAQGRLSAAWEQRRWSHFHYAFMELDSMCEDVGVLLALPITLLFAMPPAPGAAPLSAFGVILRVLLQLIIESGTDLSAAWGAVFLRRICKLRLRPVRMAHLVTTQLKLPRLHNSVVSMGAKGMLQLTPAPDTPTPADPTEAAATRLQPSLELVQPVVSKAAHGICIGALETGAPLETKSLPDAPYSPAHSLVAGRAALCKPLPPTDKDTGEQPMHDAENPLAENDSHFGEPSIGSVAVPTSSDVTTAGSAASLPHLSPPPPAMVEVQLTPVGTPSVTTTQQHKSQPAINPGCCSLAACRNSLLESLATDWQACSGGVPVPEPPRQCCGFIRQACRLANGWYNQPAELRARAAAGVYLQATYLREAQIERASLWQPVPSDIMLREASMPVGSVHGASVSIDDSGASLAHSGSGSGKPAAMSPVRRVALHLALQLEALAVRRMYAWEMLPPGLRLYFVLAVLAAAVSVVSHSFNVQLRCAYNLPSGGYKFDFCNGL